MRVLILGAAGMLGHKLCQLYRERYETWATVRSSAQEFASYELLAPERILSGVDASDFNTIIRAVARVRPNVVINCIGIIKQLPTAQDPIISIAVNSLFPHQLANLCQASGARLFHISTDCVFSGRKGMYTEADVSDAEDLYGRSKFLGETSSSGCLTLRTSIIGRELQTTSGLVEWFLSNRGRMVRGFSEAIYSGFTTHALAKIIAYLIDTQQQLNGLWQVSSEPINKYDLLVQMRDAYQLPIEITADSSVVIDRSLDSNLFRTTTGFAPPSWQSMITEMAADPTPYDTWRNRI